MKKFILVVLSLRVLTLGVNTVWAVYQPTAGEVNLIKKVENQFRARYKGKDIDGAVSEEIVEFMARLDKKLENKDIEPNVDRILGTAKWYLLRIVERTFPRGDADSTDYYDGDSMPDDAEEEENKAEDKDEGEDGDKGEIRPKSTHDGHYRLVDVDVRKWTFMPSILTLQKGDMVKLVVHDVDLEHEIYFPDLQVRKDGNGFYIIDTSNRGTYRYYCSESCGEDYDKMIGTIIIE